jgi:hypothetical protein
VALAERCDAKKMAEGVERHGGFFDAAVS